MVPILSSLARCWAAGVEPVLMAAAHVVMTFVGRQDCGDGCTSGVCRQAAGPCRYADLLACVSRVELGCDVSCRHADGTTYRPPSCLDDMPWRQCMHFHFVCAFGHLAGKKHLDACHLQAA